MGCVVAGKPSCPPMGPSTGPPAYLQPIETSTHLSLLHQNLSSPLSNTHNVDPQEKAGRGARRSSQRRERRPGRRGVSRRLLDVIPLHHVVAKTSDCLHCGRLVLCFPIGAFVLRYRASLSLRSSLCLTVSLATGSCPLSERSLYVLLFRLACSRKTRD
jgi:hypothetical protein